MFLFFAFRLPSSPLHNLFRFPSSFLSFVLSNILFSQNSNTSSPLHRPLPSNPGTVGNPSLQPLYSVQRRTNICSSFGSLGTFWLSPHRYSVQRTNPHKLRSADHHHHLSSSENWPLQATYPPAFQFPRQQRSSPLFKLRFAALCSPPPRTAPIPKLLWPIEYNLSTFPTYVILDALTLRVA